MKRLALFAIPAALILASVASAHFVTTPACGQVTFDDTTKGWTALVEPGDLVFGPFLDGDNGPYAIAAGSYTYTFEDSHGKAHETGAFSVAACDGPSPSASTSVAPSATPVPSRTPTHPHATPPVTAGEPLHHPVDSGPLVWMLAGLWVVTALLVFAHAARRPR